MLKKIYLLYLCLFALTVLKSQSFDWVKTYGGPESDRGADFVIDASGNIYICGTFRESINFTTATGNTSLVSNGSSDVFLVKLTPEGVPVWALSFGGERSEQAKQMALDENGHLLIAGNFTDVVDFDPGPGTYYLSNDLSADQFILKLDENGEFLWVNYIQNGTVEDLVLDEDGAVYAIGDFQDEIAFELNGQLETLTALGSKDVYVQKIDTDGNTLWVKQFGSTSLDTGVSIKIDALGDVYCIGTFTGVTDVDPSTATFLLESEGEYDIYVVKMNAAGELLWGKRVGSPGYDLNPKIAIRGDNQFYLTGGFNGKLHVHLIDENGDLVWEKLVAGNSDSDYISSADILVDADLQYYLTGGFIGNIDFDPSGETNVLFSGSFIDGESDCFVAKYKESGDLVWVQQIRGEGGEGGQALGMNDQQALFVLGGFSSDLEVIAANFSFNGISAGEGDLFLAKIQETVNANRDGARSPKVQISPNPSKGLVSVTLDASPLQEVSVDVFNQSGQLVQQSSFAGLDTQLDLNDLPDGVYLLQLQFDSTQTYSHQLVLQKD